MCSSDLYRASNKCDYVIQMTRWLQRQEAMDLRAAYLQWLNIPIESEDNLVPTETEEPTDDGEAEYHQEARIADAILTELKTELAPSFTYKIAKKPPFPNTSISHITSAYGVTDFLPTLQSFLNKHIPNSLNPNQFNLVMGTGNPGVFPE